MTMDESAIKQQVIDAFPEDNLREDEIILEPGGDIIIDRRKMNPRATPIVVGRWRS